MGNPGESRLYFYCRGIWAVIAILSVGMALTYRHPQVIDAHPLGNFTINHFSRIEFSSGQVYIRYILDLAEIPAFLEMASIDLDGDEQVSDAERANYLPSKVDELRRGLHLSINGSARGLEVIDQELSFPPGQGSLPTLRLSLLLRGPTLQTGQTEQDLYYRDDNYSQRLGWREIVVQVGENVSLIQSNVPQRDRSEELRTYPEEMLNSPPDQREARLTFVLTPGTVEEARPNPLATEPVTRRKDTLTSLIATDNLSLPVVIISTIIALGLGAFHALTPGHGKTIMAAYLVGTRGTAAHALFLGLTVTISHTLGVLALGLVTLYASHRITPERLYPWLGLASGSIIAAIGSWLLITRLRGHEIAFHSHEAGTDFKPVPTSHTPARVVASRPASSHRHGHSHHHLPSQAPTSQRNERLSITWKNLAVLGIAGGLVPSVSALVILLAAISMDRVGFGLVLILAFSAGMAGVLSGVGLLLVYAGRLLERLPFGSTSGRPARALARALPWITALVVLVSGLVLAIRAVFQIGLA